MDELAVHVVAAVASLTQSVGGADAGSVPHFVYILECADGRRYVGSTADLSRRLAEHQLGLSRWTAPRRPVKLLYYETCESAAHARKRERSLKNGRTRRKTIDAMIASFPLDRLAPFS